MNSGGSNSNEMLMLVNLIIVMHVFIMLLLLYINIMTTRRTVPTSECGWLWLWCAAVCNVQLQRATSDKIAVSLYIVGSSNLIEVRCQQTPSCSFS